MAACCYALRNTRRVGALGSRKDTAVWTECSRSQNSDQCGTIQKLTRTVGLDLGKRERGSGDN